MDVTALIPLLLACAPMVSPVTAQALIQVESGFNPYAIGVVGGSLVRQPRSHAEAMATIRHLQAQGYDYSVGLAQINQRNFSRLGLTPDTALQPCQNLQAMQVVLGDCHQRSPRQEQPQHAVRNALSCYYSGNYSTGYHHGYVQRVVAAAARITPSTRFPPPTRP